MQASVSNEKLTVAPATLRVCPAQIEVVPGRPAENTACMLAVIAQARNAGAELVVFPELAIPGRLLGDTWNLPAFLRECAACGERIREAAQGLTVIFGNVAVDWSKRNEDGRPRKYNALFIASAGAFHGPSGSPYPLIVKPDFLSPRFDDSRYFYDLYRLAQECGVAPEIFFAPVSAGRVTIGYAQPCDFRASPSAAPVR